MPISMVVANIQPEISEDLPQQLLDLFQDYTFHRDGQRYYPFKHQAEAFRLVGIENKEAFIVAGTASGKTLAIAIPLFWKLKQGLIRKVLLMYPTVALLEDQRKVMDTLAEITGLEVGQLQGGMSRSKLIEALNKPVILATPDEVYWFFRKNVKYSSLLIYGLALVDEFVLDEGHLFNGMMLRNLAHLKTRVQLLGQKIGKRSRWHILTATPTEELRGLMTAGAEIKGQSKCGDVEVTFLEPAGSYGERQDKLVRATESSIEEGSNKVLLVFNSADLAHRVFEVIRGKAYAEIPAEMKLRFGRVRWDRFKAWLEEEKIGPEHEASTFDYEIPQLVESPKEEIAGELHEVLRYRTDLASLDGAMEHIWAFAVSHHGLFYLSYERGRDQVLRPLIRRQWTSSYPNEERRITLVNLLFEYHSLGGLVMILDLVASYCYKKGKDYQALFGEVESLGELVEWMIERADEVEAARDYWLMDTLMLYVNPLSIPKSQTSVKGL